ncbi:uncharacterized protein LOC144662599 isoform X1 [Oculina patagonica]
MPSGLCWYSLILTLVLPVDKGEMQWTCKQCAVGLWTSWTPCTQPCGNGGTKTRTRPITTFPTCGDSCPTLSETLSCKTRCPNGGTPISGRDGKCSCKVGYSGQCCTQIDAIETLGCYNDTSKHAIPTLEGQDGILNGNATSRRDPIGKCYEAAKKRGFKVFALQDGGWCSSSATAEKTFNKYGISSNCKSDGEGGPLANQVYYIKDYKGVGCYRDTADHAIPTLEGTDSILDGEYWNRQNTIVKCAVAARKRDFLAFALQDGGWCASSATARETFYKYGQNNDCKENGEGGNWANNVYVFQDKRYNSCYEVNLETALSRPGWANCSLGRYLNGLWRKIDAVISSPGGIDNIKKGRCCIPPHEYEDDTPVCQTVDWKTSLSRKNKWASCPEGYFLQGIFRSRGTGLHSIEQALCCRPRNFENTKKDCYDKDVRKSQYKKGWSKCREWYYIMGVYKGDCDKLNCIEMIKCCRMRPQDMVVLGHWMLNGQDKDISLIGSPSFIRGRCPGSKAAYFNQTNSFASAPIINFNGRSFTIAFWIKQPKSASDELGAIYSDWYNPRQFLLSTKKQKIKLQRQQKGYDTLWSLESANITMDNWTHVAVTWETVTGSVLIYADGKINGKGSYFLGNTFSEPTGLQYLIGEVGHRDRHHFYGSVADLYVFGTALSLEQINKLRGFPVIVNKTKDVPGGTVAVCWEPPFEGTCPIVNYTVNYREVLSPTRNSKWHSVTVNRNATSLTLQLRCNTEYDIAVTSLSGYGESALNESKIWNFKTGGDLPSRPVINNRETETSGCDVYPTWSPPADNGCPLTMYSIYYQQITEAAWYQVNVTNVTATKYTVSLACGRQYTIEISAWNEMGESDRSRPWMIKTKSKVGGGGPTPLPYPQTPLSSPPPAFQSGNGLQSSTQLAGLVAGLSVLFVVVFMVIFWLRRKARKNKQLARQPRRSKSTIIPLWRWEVLPQQVVFEEEIGRGAFGKVLKGTYKESPGIEVFYKTRTQTVDFKEGRTVAIKVLGDTADEEARNQLLEEIEIMKAIGSHRNVVSMLGCWVNSDPIFLLLEYVPYGDLQRWLRNKRMQKSYQKNYYNEGDPLRLDAIEECFGVDDESKALLVRDEGEDKELVHCDKPTMDGTNNDLVDSARRYTLDPASQDDAAKESKPDVEGRKKSTQVPQNTRHGTVQHEEDFIAKDLLCFAWQIARGMKFLSSNGFVHRDLAARNVLLGEDKIVKISDFGLMRQTHESVYQIKKGKKIPVKWMAPEALYNSEYTTKSDVWSFGILLWELSTMGGNPYPGINNKELHNLLKTGYRMEKPDTCSDKLYQLVLDCWKDEPSERPTFESATRSLEQMMQEDTPYLDFESLDESKAYYCNEKLSDEDVTV